MYSVRELTRLVTAKNIIAKFICFYFTNLNRKLS